MSKVKEEKKVKVSIPSKGSILICNVTAYISIGFGIFTILCAAFGYFAQDSGFYESALAGEKIYAETILILINLQLLTLGMGLYFFVIAFGLLKVSHIRNVESQMAKIMRQSRGGLSSEYR